jgi:hypothetical protein
MAADVYDRIDAWIVLKVGLDLVLVADACVLGVGRSVPN